METTTGDVPLPPGRQTRNLLLFAACTALQYFTAPVLYVGVMQASLCHDLGASDAVANLPETAYLGLTFAPVILAWLIPYVSWLKRNLVTYYVTVALSQGLVALALLSPLPPGMQIAAVVAQAAVAGVTMPTAVACLWEVIGRGAAERRRGLALGLAFGVGPLFAVGGSLGSQLLLAGEVDAAKTFGLTFLGDAAVLRLPLQPFPKNFAVLYAVAAPAMLLAATLSCFFVVPSPEVEATRRPFVEAVFGGLWDFLRNPVLLTATVVTILVYTGNTITSNLNLYSKVVFGESPTLHAGNQNAVRFACKMLAGLLLGWLLTRTNPKVGLLATSFTFVASVGWAMVAPAELYLLVFGIYGAGELVGVYAPNYILSASRPEDIRRNMAFVTMMMAPAAPAGYLFGLISDVVGKMYDKPTGYRASFAVCAVLMLLGIVLAVLFLPARPGAQAGKKPEVAFQPK